MRVARAHSQGQTCHHALTNCQNFGQIGLPSCSQPISPGTFVADRAAPPCPCQQVPLVLDFLLHFPATPRGRDERKFDTSMANDFLFCYKLDIVYSISRVIAMPFELTL